MLNLVFLVLASTAFVQADIVKVQTYTNPVTDPRFVTCSDFTGDQSIIDTDDSSSALNTPNPFTVYNIVSLSSAYDQVQCQFFDNNGPIGTIDFENNSPENNRGNCLAGKPVRVTCLVLPRDDTKRSVAVEARQQQATGQAIMQTYTDGVCTEFTGDITTIKEGNETRVNHPNAFTTFNIVNVNSDDEVICTFFNAHGTDLEPQNQISFRENGIHGGGLDDNPCNCLVGNPEFVVCDFVSISSGSKRSMRKAERSPVVCPGCGLNRDNQDFTPKRGMAVSFKA